MKQSLVRSVINRLISGSTPRSTGVRPVPRYSPSTLTVQSGVTGTERSLEMYASWRSHHPDDFKPVNCPRCYRPSEETLIHPKAGRLKWCKTCKLVYNKDGVVYDVLADYEKQWLSEEK